MASEHWHEALRGALARAQGGGRQGGGDPEAPALEGRILKIKFGYNPNSSSVGSVVNVLFWTATASALAVNLMSALLAARAQRRLEVLEADPEGAPEDAAGDEVPP